MPETVDSQYTNPKSWGPHFWFMMRCTANNYSDKPTEFDKKLARAFYNNFRFTLPCKMCKTHYNDLLKKHSLDKALCCRSCLIKWVEKMYIEIKKVAV